MKFKLLSVGQKFKYQDVVYVKTSPIVASNVETGHNKMIPAYAALILLDNNSEAAPELLEESLVADDVLKTFNLFYEKCISILETHNVNVPIIKDELDKARDEFSQKLHKKN